MTTRNEAANAVCEFLSTVKVDRRFTYEGVPLPTTMAHADGDRSRVLMMAWIETLNKPTNEGMHMDDESKGSGVDVRLNELAQHCALWGAFGDGGRAGRMRESGSPAVAMARLILSNPQAHVDALVSAGVLVRIKYADGIDDRYTVVPPEPPHVHSWEVNGLHEDVLAVRCGCGKSKWVENKLPIEVPE